MKSKFMRGLALGLAMVTAFTFSAPNSALLNAQAAKAKMTASAKSIKAGGTVTYKVTNLNKKYYYTVKVTGAGKTLVQVKQGSKTIKSYKKTAVSAKKKVGAKTLTLKVKNKSTKTSAQKYTVTVKVYKTKSAKKAFKTFKTTTTIKKKAAAKKIAATGVTLDKNAYTVGVGQSTTLYATVAPADTTDIPVWSSSDETVATVANGVVTGVKEGKATITVKYNDEVSASAEVTVSKDAIIYSLTGAKQVAANKVELTFDNAEAKNLTTDLNQIFITNTTNSTRINVAKIDWNAAGDVGVATLASNFADNTEYEAKFKENGTPIKFTAVIGEVASILIKTTQAEKGKETPIEFELLNATGIDVTAAKSVDRYTTIASTGSGLSKGDEPTKATITLYNIGDTETITVTYKEGNKDEIKQDGVITCVDNTPLEGTGVFALTDDLHTVNGSSVAKFYRSGVSDKEIKVAANDNNYDNLYFYAKDADGNALKYDSYVVESADRKVVDVSTYSSGSSSKFVNITIDPIAAGTTNLIVKATSYGKDTEYYIPVIVTEASKLQSIQVDANKSKISNAFDEQYYGEIQAYGIDNLGRKRQLDNATLKIKGLTDSSNGVVNAVVSNPAAGVELGDEATSGDKQTGEVSGGLTYGIMISPTMPATSWTTGDTTMATTDGDIVRKAGSAISEKSFKAYYQAWGAVASSVTFEVEGALNGDTKKGQADVTINKLPKAAWSNAGTGLSYYVEINDETRDAAFGDAATAKLAAMAGGYFAGYVHVGATSDATVTIGGKSTGASNESTKCNALSGGAVKATTPTKIKNVRMYVSNATNSYIQTGNAASTAVNLFGSFTVTKNDAKIADMYQAGSLATMAEGDVATTVVQTRTAAGATYKYIAKNKQVYDLSYARNMKYTVTARFDMGTSETNKEVNKSFTVKNSIDDIASTVKATTNRVDDLDNNDIRDSLVFGADLNSDNAYDSFTALYKYNAESGTTPAYVSTPVTKDSKKDVDYVSYVETLFGSDGTPKGSVEILLPINATFYRK